jgi:Zn-dependent peptidase ImmA (M78 family)
VPAASTARRAQAESANEFPMLRSQYYEALKQLARETRVEYGLASPRVLRSDLRRIYRDQGIRIDLWDHKFKKLRGAYFNDELGPMVMLYKNLPEDPMVFTMAHELKHHLTDSNLALSYCDSSNQAEQIEIGAEVFAAELIYPEGQFAADLQAMGTGIGSCTPESIVRLKRETRTTLSYAGLVKRAEFLGLASSGALQGIKWKKLEESIYGPPVYKRILARRAARR